MSIPKLASVKREHILQNKLAAVWDWASLFKIKADDSPTLGSKSFAPSE